MYKAIFKSAEQVDSKALYAEFLAWPNAKLNPVYHGNSDWTGICVYQRCGVNHLEELPVLRSLLSRVGLNHVTGVTYFNLAPNSKLHRHRDMYGNLLFGISRLHIPIQTNPAAIMEVQSVPYHLGLNELWCLDTSGLHALRNDGDENRVHIVIDIKRHADTEKYFPRWTWPVLVHLGGFLAIVTWKIARDILLRPATILNRLKGLRTQY